MTSRDDPRSLVRRLWRPYPTGPNILSTSFSQPLGANFEPGKMHGYYIDMRVKADSPSWPPRWFQAGSSTMWVAIAQLGLGCHERYISGEGDRWLDAAIAVGDQLVSEQEAEGPRRGGWAHRFPCPHTFRVPPPWLSAMAQGEAASLLVRLAKLTSDDRYADAAREAMRPMQKPSVDGGVVARLNGGPFFEEYPTNPPSFVLNGAIFALWGCYDVAAGLGETSARELFEEGCDALASNLDRFDIGYWSRYDLFPHRVVNVASLAYHQLHIDQLRATALITGRSVFDEVAARFTRYRNSRLSLARASARKIAFRLLLPRKRY